MICVSIVSHGHGQMVHKLVTQILACPSVGQLVVTLNIPEDFPILANDRLLIIQNPIGRGFGANHNAAFEFCRQPYFCVLNPDIELIDDPFPTMIKAFGEDSIGLVAPLIMNASGATEDSMRVFLTPWTLLKRLIGINDGAYPARQENNCPDWVAGMFMLFRSEAYAKVRGFDERYFMYCEDADICTRLWKVGYKVVGCLSASVIHNAQRASHRSWKHLRSHLRSMIRYFLSHSFSLPDKSG